jgi:hypothetical protein
MLESACYPFLFILFAQMKIDFLENYDDEALLEELRRIAQVTGKETVTKADIELYGRCSYSIINKRFGPLRKALDKAGLSSTRYTKATDEELLSILCELWEKTLSQEGRCPERKDLKAFGYPVSPDVFYQRFGSWKKALINAYNFASDENKYLDENVALFEIKNISQSKRENLSIRKRFFIMKRDEFSCKLCGASGAGVRLEVDHIIPFSQGGTDRLDNLQTLCFECNRGKRDSYQ